VGICCFSSFLCPGLHLLHVIDEKSTLSSCADQARFIGGNHNYLAPEGYKHGYQFIPHICIKPSELKNGMNS
jgi:hypothetical protein